MEPEQKSILVKVIMCVILMLSFILNIYIVPLQESYSKAQCTQ